MHNKDVDDIKKQIKDYLKGVDNNVFPNKLKNNVSIFLCGSTGWGNKRRI